MEQNIKFYSKDQFKYVKRVIAVHPKWVQPVWNPTHYFQVLNSTKIPNLKNEDEA